ncbi:MAG: sialidase family protein [Anaerolineales bacterium]
MNGDQWKVESRWQDTELKGFTIGKLEDEMERNEGFENSLRCLQHPLSLASVALLLLNDHVFKVFFSSWLTGKLSDFAGLYFFPFIVAAGLSILLSKFNSQPRIIGQVSFLLVGIWFFLLKTSPYINSITSQFASHIVDFPTQFSLDWTDLFGLIAMLPAWNLWKQSQQWRRSKFAYIALSIGAFAAIASSPAAPTVEAATHLAIKDKSVLASDMISRTMAISKDGGKTWEPQYEFDQTQFPNQYISLPIVVCAPNNQNECYRVNGNGNVEISEDAGNSWRISWELPPERIAYLDRVNPGMDLGPHDLIIIKWKDQDYVLVAVGKEGILRKELPNGEWERISVQNAEPTPYRAENFSSIFAAVWREALIWFLLSLLAFATACLMAWRINSENSQEKFGVWEWIILPSLSPLAGLLGAVSVQLMIVILGLVIGQVALLVLPFDLFPILLIVVAGALLAALAVWPRTVNRELTRWKEVLTDHHYSSQISNEIATTALQSHLLTFLAGLVVWLAWGFGFIQRYEVAMALAMFCSGCIAIFFIRRVQKLSQKNEASEDSNRQS